MNSDIYEISEEDEQAMEEDDAWQKNPNNPYHDTQGKINVTKKPETQTNETNYNARYLLKANLRKEATEELTKQIKKKYVIYTTRDDEKSECWIYEEGIFKPEAKTYIQEFIRREIGEWYTSQISNAVISKIEADTYIEQDDFFSRQNKYPFLIPVKNGVLNIDTLELLEHKPEYCFFNKLPVSYMPNLDCPNIKKFLTDVLPDQESIDTIQEFYGSCLLKEYRYEKCLLVTGTGSNGKGKTIELLKHLLGIDNCAEISPQALEEDMFAMGELVNKMANISADINSKALQNTGVFKSLTGRDLMMGARKFKTRVKFINYAKFIFSANEVPDTKDITDGFFRRWLIVDFPNKFLDKEDYDEADEIDKNIIKIKDPEIIQKITTPEELNGLLNWCLEGYHRIKELKQFSCTQTINKVRTMWMRKSNSVQAFIMDCIKEDYDEVISKSDFKMWYVSYCRRHKLKQMNDKSIKEILTSNMNVFDERRVVGDSQKYVWVGISFINFGVER